MKFQFVIYNMPSGYFFKTVFLLDFTNIKPLKSKFTEALNVTFCLYKSASNRIQEM